MKPIVFVLYGRPNCDLCDRLYELIKPYVDAIAARTPVKFSKRNVDSDPELAERYGDRIPVLTRNDQIILEGRPDPQGIAQAFQANSPS